MNARGNAGDPLPIVWESLKDSRFLRGQLCLICAGPGTGKSAFVLTYAVKAKVPTLYFSADSDAFTQLSRQISILTGMPISESTELARSRDLSSVEDLLGESLVRFDLKSTPLLSEIKESMESYNEVYGDYPTLVVIDNVTNVRAGQEAEEPFEGLESLMDCLHKLARESGSFIAGLHHVTGPNNNGNQPIPLGGVKGQIARVPELVLTLHKVTSEFGPDTLNVSTVKSRMGKMDPSGNDFVSLEFIGDTMQIRDFAR